MIQNVTLFALGLVIGMVVDWIAIRAYNQIDPQKESNVKLAAIVLTQLVVLFAIHEWLKSVS